MNNIRSYEEFCQAFSSENVNLKQQAELLLFIQNWIIQIVESIRRDSLDFSLRKLSETISILNNIEQSSDKVFKDELSYIMDNSETAIRYLMNNMREKIIRENIKMPAYKVREINGYCLNWLSRQAGKSVREKMASTGNSIMGVRRRMSLDTSENRLFIAFIQKLLNEIDYKVKFFPDKYINNEEEFVSDMLIFLRSDELSEIKRWDNPPPNNPLLSDQNYNKIWCCWNRLKDIDNITEDMVEKLDIRLATIFYIEMLTVLSDIMNIPQMPVEVDYVDFKVYLAKNEIRGIDKKKREYVFLKKGNIIIINNTTGVAKAVLDNGEVCIFMNDVKLMEVKISYDNINACIREFLKVIEIDFDNRNPKILTIEPYKSKSIIIDIFSLYPTLIDMEGAYVELPMRLLQQEYFSDNVANNMKKYYLPCDTTDTLEMNNRYTNTYNVSTAIDNINSEQINKLMYMLDNYIETTGLSYIFPDAYNDLQLSKLYKAAKLLYPDVSAIPCSIGAAFFYQTTRAFKEKFNPNDFLLVINIVDDDMTFTLLEGKDNQEISKLISDYNGMVWERHPTANISIKSIIEKELLSKLEDKGCQNSEKLYKLLRLKGIEESTNKLTVFYEEGHFTFDEDTAKLIKDFKIDCTVLVEEFIAKNTKITSNSIVHVMSLDNAICYNGLLDYIKVDIKEILIGCSYLQRLNQKISTPLWYDYLPNLSIKLMYGKFDLIKDAASNNRVIPKYGKPTSIKINNTFILPKGCKQYNFHLVQDEDAKQMNFEAVIKNPVFPLKEDLECRLLMTYQYGTEDPYELIFKPLDTSNKKPFTQVKVIWNKVERYNTNLKAPRFPTKIPWEKYRHFLGNDDSELDLLDIFTEYFEAIGFGYKEIDISKGLYYEVNRKFFGQFYYTINDKMIRVIWRNFGSKDNEPNKIEQKLRFWLSPENNGNGKRYQINKISSLSKGFINRRYGYQAMVPFIYKGEKKLLAIYESNFRYLEHFYESIEAIDFSIYTNKNGDIKAVDIIPDKFVDKETKMRRYEASNITGENIETLPPSVYINAFYNKMLRTLFSNNRSISEVDCPKELRDNILQSKTNFLKLYYKYRNPYEKKVMIILLSLLAQDLGGDYYNIASQYLEGVGEKKLDLAYEIGYGCCALTTKAEKNLLKKIQNKIKNIDKLIGVLAKAAWHNERFIYNMNRDVLIEEYLPQSVNSVRQIIERQNTYSDKGKKNLANHLEFILATLRLRTLGDEKVDEKLSFNNPIMIQLYKCLELLIDNKINLKSFLKLEITNKGMYHDVCDLVYVLLVYVTGSTAESEIRISGINVDELDN